MNTTNFFADMLTTAQKDEQIADLVAAIEVFADAIENTSIFSQPEFKAWMGLLDALAKAKGETKMSQPDIDICTECGEHAEFDEDTGESNCCGAKPGCTDRDTDMER